MLQHLLYGDTSAAIKLLNHFFYWLFQNYFYGNFILAFPVTNKGKHDKLVWLGGRDAVMEGSWKWECDESSIGNPSIFHKDNYDEAPPVRNADCLAWAYRSSPSSMTYYWGDENCKEKKYPLCKCDTCQCGQGKYYR